MAHLHDEFHHANEKFASGFTAGHTAMPPARKVAVLTCMDARLHPELFLGLEIGDSHVIRNAGGRASDDALRSLAISQRLLGTQEIHIIHHTDCGMLTFENSDIRAKIKADLGVDVDPNKDFLPFKDVEKSVRDDVSTVQNSDIIAPGTPVYGYIYDVKTGKLADIAI